MADLKERIPPQAIDAEQSVLGAILQNTDSLHLGIELLTVENFYLPKHRIIFNAISKLYNQSNAVDLITVTDALVSAGRLDEIGGKRYLINLTDSVVTFTNIEDHIRIVLEAAVKNQLINDCGDIVSRCYDPANESDDVLDYAEQRIFAIKENSLKGDVIPIGGILHDTMEQIDEYSKRDGRVTGVPSGYMDLDELTSGFQPSDLVIIAARPSMGKTAFALNIIENISVGRDFPVLLFSLEMTKEQIAQRILCSRAKISSHRIRTGRIADHEWSNLNIALGPLSEAPIYIDDSASLSIMEIRAKARRGVLRYGLKMIVLDYLQLVRGQRNPESRQQEITYISQSLKALARELRVPVIALSQLSRQVENRGPAAKPQLSDLRESGALEQDADVVVFIHRGRDENGILGEDAEIIIGKQRNGPTGLVHLTFKRDYARFELQTTTYQAPYKRESPE